MTFPEFDHYSEELIKKCFNMRSTKGKEYAHSSEDRFANFNRIAERKGVPRLLVASIYLQKHLDGIDSFIASGKIHSEERIEGRIIDAITYLMLIAGMIEEDHQNLKIIPEKDWNLKGLPKVEIPSIYHSNADKCNNPSCGCHAL